MPETAQEAMRRMSDIRPWHDIERAVTEPHGKWMSLYVQAAPISEREMATQPLTSPAIDRDSVYVDPDTDLLVQLRVMLDMATATISI